MMDDLRERNFEDDICAWLCEHGGYTAGDPARFDRTRALDVQTLLDVVRTSQPEAWKKHEQRNPGKAEAVFLDSFCKEVQKHSLLDVLRRGFSILGVPFRVVFWQPENDLNPETVALYRRNVLHCTRQLRYSSHNENSVDVTLLVNGIPVTAQLTGIVRGMLPAGIPVTAGMKSGDIDPRCEVRHCFTVSDKARAIGGGVLEGILYFGRRLRLWND